MLTVAVRVSHSVIVMTMMIILMTLR